jgi:hypothetical protein
MRSSKVCDEILIDREFALFVRARKGEHIVGIAAQSITAALVSFHENSDENHATTKFLNRADCLLNGTASGDYVVDNRHVRAFSQAWSTAEVGLRNAVLGAVLLLLLSNDEGWQFDTTIERCLAYGVRNGDRPDLQATDRPRAGLEDGVDQDSANGSG